MVLVFKTSVKNKEEINIISPLLNAHISSAHWNFDLDDCDKILRVESTNVEAHQLISLLNQNGFECSELED
jgi:hypothetical protein